MVIVALVALNDSFPGVEATTVASPYPFTWNVKLFLSADGVMEMTFLLETEYEMDRFSSDGLYETSSPSALTVTLSEYVISGAWSVPGSKRVP